MSTKATGPTRLLVPSEDPLLVLVDGEQSLDGRVSLDVLDPAINLGMGIFETLRAYRGELFDLDSHLERLAASALAMGMAEPPLERIASELTDSARHIGGDVMARVTITGGGVRIVTIRPLPLTPSPFRCATRQFVPPAWLDGTVKHISRGYSRRAVADAGVDEVLWLDESGYVLEGTRSNVFAVFGRTLVTPPVDGRILAGVTRAAIIDAADEIDVTVEIRPFTIADGPDELYVASTLKELTAVDELDGTTFSGKGPVGDAVAASFRRLLG